MMCLWPEHVVIVSDGQLAATNHTVSDPLMTWKYKTVIYMFHKSPIILPITLITFYYMFPQKRENCRKQFLGKEQLLGICMLECMRKSRRSLVYFLQPLPPHPKEFGHAALHCLFASSRELSNEGQGRCTKKERNVPDRSRDDKSCPEKQGCFPLIWNVPSWWVCKI